MKKHVLLLLLVMAVAVFVAGCGGSTAPATGNSPATPEKTYKWVAQSPWPSGTTLHWMAEEIAREITTASGGRLEVQMQPVGTIVGALDLLDAVSTGTLDAVHSWEGYWVGQIPAAGFFAAMPLGLNEQEYMTWVLQDEGTALWEEAFQDYNIKLLPAGAYTPEVFYHSRKPIYTLDDLKGMKVRGVGFWGAIQSRFGASVVAVAGGEVFQALERGVVDAAEYATPTDNFNLGFHEVAPYLIVPGSHQPTSVFSFMVNQDKWDELPDDLKAIVRVVTERMWGKAWAYAAYQDMDTMQKFKQLENEGKLTIIEFDAASQAQMKVLADEYYAELAAGDPLFDKVWKSQIKFLERYKYWRDYMSPKY
ncbi:MAG: TRAP transporter substrate-binding protein DctP [Clostridiales bacterium]|nr:TRAP transporter substrate-binding protein DctP [Clostridiales bacterium]